jgi:hypothetical protein
LQNGHPVRLFSYEPIPNLPQGTIWEDGRAILPESAIFTNPSAEGHGGLSMFSNFFRYQLLLLRSRWWLYARFVGTVFRERLPDQNNSPPGIRANCCVFKAPAGSAVVARALEIAQATDLATALWSSTGPRALQKAVTELGLTQFMLTPDVINPIAWWQVETLISGLTTLPANAHAVHFYNEVWRRNFFDKNADYDPLSLFERLKARYLGGKEAAHA